MERNLLDVVGKSKLVDMEIIVPSSKEREFSEKYEKRGWGSERLGNVSTFYSNTVGTETAKRLCRKLPDYAQVSVSFFSNPEDPFFYKGPLIVDREGFVDFIGSYVSLIERELDKLEKKIETSI